MLLFLIILINIPRGISFVVNRNLRANPKSWRDTKTITTLASKPINSVFYRFENKESNTSVIVYVDFNEYIEVLQLDITEILKSNDIDTQLASIVIEQTNIYAKTSSEIDVAQLQAYLTKKNLKIGESLYKEQLKDSLIKLMSQCKSTVLDTIDNIFVPNILYKEWGYFCGELCGESSEQYLLPNGKVFIDEFSIS